MTQASPVAAAIRQAEQAQRQAAEAQEKAARAAQAVKAAQAELRARQERARQEWAQKVAAAYPDDAQQAQRAFDDARTAFYRVAVTDPAQTVAAFGAWQAAYARIHVLSVRMSEAASTLGQPFRAPNVTEIPPFSTAMDHAMDRRLANIVEDLRDAYQAEIQAVLDGMEA